MDSGKQPQGLIRLFDKLIGMWDVELTIKLADGSTFKGKGELNAKEIVNGFGARTEWTLMSTVWANVLGRIFGAISAGRKNSFLHHYYDSSCS